MVGQHAIQILQSCYLGNWEFDVSSLREGFNLLKRIQLKRVNVYRVMVLLVESRGLSCTRSRWLGSRCKEIGQLEAMYAVKARQDTREDRVTLSELDNYEGAFLANCV